MSEAILSRLRDGLVRTTRQSMEIICLNASITASTVELSVTSDDPRNVSDANRIDRELMAYLINRKMINWCDKTCKLAPLRNEETNGSGLLRAVTSSIWGQHDEAIDSFLRRLLHVTLTSGKQQRSFKDRWQLEEEKVVHHSDAQCQTEDAWEDAYSAFQGKELQTKDDIALHPIHIFSLSNILRRPVLILGDTSSAATGPSISDLTGIYLPLLSSAESCVPYPLVLIRHEGLFHALLVNRVPLEWWQVQSFRSVPLVRIDQEPFHIRCLLESESRRVRDLLLTYLNIAEISHTTPSGAIQVLTSRLSSKKPESPNCDDVFANVPPINANPPFDSFLATDEVPSEEEEAAAAGFHLTGVASALEGSGCVRNCIACQTIRREEQRKLMNSRPQSESSESRSLRRTYSTRCENAKCKKEGSQKYGGRCYACYVVRDPCPMGVSNGDGKRRNPMIGKREEGLICPKVEEMKKLAVANFVWNSRMEKDVHDATKRVERIAETEVKVTQRPVRVEDKDEVARFKHTHEHEFVKGKSEKDEGKHESEDITDEIPFSTIGNDKISNRHESGSVTGAGDPVRASCTKESVVVSGSHGSRNDPQPTAEHLVTSGHALDLVVGSEERWRDIENECIVDFCSNAAENSYRGLCKTCYETLARHRTPKDQQVIPAVLTSTVASIQCLMEDCDGQVTNQQLGLCLPCLRTQIFAARDLERRKEQRRNLLDPSYSAYKVHPTTTVLPEKRSPRSERQKIPKSPKDVHSAKVPSPPTFQRSGATQWNNHSSTTAKKAKCCLTTNCDRYGDPSFDGYCSLCYERFSPRLLVPRS